MKRLYLVQIAPGLAFEAAADDALAVRPGLKVLVKCEFYQDIALVKAVSMTPFGTEEEIRQMEERQSRGRHVEGHVVPEILRVATEGDIRRAGYNEGTALGMRRKSIERIRAHGLEMRLIQCHLTFDGRLLIGQFTADGRVDFRKLLLDLSLLFRTRIELRQVGVRDEAAIIGGVGSCGRPYCCATFLRNIASVNVRMAKQQGLSLTPQNISGACGRLKCCLHFEHESNPNAAHTHALDGMAEEGGDGERTPNAKRDRPPRVKPPFAPPRRHEKNDVDDHGKGIMIPLKSAGLVPLKKTDKPE